MSSRLRTLGFIGIIIAVQIIITLKILPDGKKSENENEKKPVVVDQSKDTKEYPVQDIWVFRYNYQTKESEFAPCGYLDEYTSAVIETEEELDDVIAGSYMYLGTIKGYQNEDKTMEVYQVRLPELSENFVLTNDDIKLDYSGNRKMIEVNGWVYIDGTTILAVSPLYTEE